VKRAAIVFGLALVMAGAGAADLPAYPFVSTGGKAQLWLKPDIGELQFDAGTQAPDAAAAAAALEETCAAVAALLLEHGVADSDIDGSELTKKTVRLTRPTADGITEVHALERHYRVQVRDLTQWPPLIAALLARDHVAALAVSFDRSDSDAVNRDLLAQAADDARANAMLLARSFGRPLGAVQAIARGPLDRVAPAIFNAADGGRAVAPGPKPTSSYTVPPSIPFAQAVTAVFRLK
jgi:uncharacterized protein YggE